jgi:hypothetical protein
VKEQEMNRRLTSTQIVDIGAELRKVCKQGADGFWDYEKPWSDEALAKAHDASHHAVKGLRIRLRMISRPRSPGKYKIGRQVEALEKKVADIETRYDSIYEWLFKWSEKMRELHNEPVITRETKDLLEQFFADHKAV